MSTPNYLGTFRGDIKEARRWLCNMNRASAKEKAWTHRRFRRMGRQAIREGREPMDKMAVDYCL